MSLDPGGGRPCMATDRPTQLCFADPDGNRFLLVAPPTG